MGKREGVFALLLAGFIWAGTGLSYKLFLSVGFTFILLLLITRFFKLLSVLGIAYAKKVKHIPLNDFKELKFLFLNAVSSVATPVFFILALSYSSLSNVYSLQYTMPVWVFILAAFFLKEKINFKKILAVFMTILGIVFISRPENLFSINLGIVFGILSALSFSADIILSRELKDYHYHTVSIYTNTFQVIILTLLALFIFPQSLFASSSLPLIVFLAVALIGIFLGIASDLYYFALEKIDASTAGIVTLCELFFASAFAFIFLGEFPVFFEIIGYGFILFSAIVMLLRKSDIEHFEHLLHLRKTH